ncbi:MAG: 2-dehydropantoate 2-reductase [Pseudomonadota bacterium]|nr:2-dehydropantoate 2-reductase [Pseudomonadota bacterium]
MKVTIFGAGAVGGFIGTRLALSGCQVAAIARGATAAALRTRGWRLQTGDTTVTAPARVAEEPGELGPQELVVVAVKGPSLAAVASAISPLLDRDTVVMTAMNGVPWWFFHGFGGQYAATQLDSIDPDGSIAANIPARHVVGCVVHAACATPEPGLTRHNVGNRLIIGEPRGGDSPRVRELAATLSRAAFDVEVSSCIQRDVWYKLWGNMTMNPVSALTGATLDRMLDDPLVNGFCLGVMAEAAAIGAAIGCPIEQSGHDRNTITRKLGAVKTSMLQDVEAGRPVEIDVLLSAAREIGQKIGQSTPQLDALLGLSRLQARVRGLYPSDASRSTNSEGRRLTLTTLVVNVQTTIGA